jgi:hypothetical protein
MKQSNVRREPKDLLFMAGMVASTHDFDCPESPDENTNCDSDPEVLDNSWLARKM